MINHKLILDNCEIHFTHDIAKKLIYQDKLLVFYAPKDVDVKRGLVKDTTKVNTQQTNLNKSNAFGGGPN